MTLCTSWILLLLLRWYPQNLGLIASSSTKSYWSKSLIFFKMISAWPNAFEFIFVNWGNLARKWHSGWKSLNKKYDFSTLTSMLVLIMDQLYFTLVLLMDMLKLSNFVIHIFGAKIQMRHFWFFSNTVNGRDDEQTKASRLRISHYSKEEPVAEYH